MFHELPKGIQKVSREVKFNLILFRTGDALGRYNIASHFLLRGCPKFQVFIPNLLLFIILYLLMYFHLGNF